MKESNMKLDIKMFVFIKKVFFTGLTILSILANVYTLKCISRNNQEYKVRPEIVNVNSNQPVFYRFSIKTSKCSMCCNNNNDRYAKLCVPDVIKNMSIEVFNLMSITNEWRHIKWDESCKCKYRLDPSVCNGKQLWNDDKCRYECKKFIDKGICNKGFICNPSKCECECDKSSDVGNIYIIRTVGVGKH